MFLLFILCADELRQELRGLYPCIWQSESRNACTGSQGRTDFKRGHRKGLKEEAHHATGELLKEQAPLEIINEHLIPALDTVGKGFEKGTVFLPQLLMSADAAKIAFAVIKDVLAQEGGEVQAKNKVILATVKGDIHDIGKNIVKVLLENYSFDVIDLGKDVPPEVIVDTAVEQNIRLVGLSAYDNNGCKHGRDHQVIERT